MTLGSFFSVSASLSVKFSGALGVKDSFAPVVALSSWINFNFGFSFDPALEIGLLRLGGVGAAGSGFDFSRRAIELGGAGTVYRGAEAVAWVAALSKGDRIARVRSNHGSMGPCPCRDGRPPRRFFVADSS